MIFNLFKEQKHLIVSLATISFIIFLAFISTAQGRDETIKENTVESGIKRLTQNGTKSIAISRSELSIINLKTLKEEKRDEQNKKRLDFYKKKLNKYRFFQGKKSILITGYSSTPDQTWGDPFTTASGTRVHKGTMACPPQYPFGTKIQIKGRGTFICEDRGGAIKGNHFDMWFSSRKKALTWGKRLVMAEIKK